LLTGRESVMYNVLDTKRGHIEVTPLRGG
jgi:hypothetical protein